MIDLNKFITEFQDYLAPKLDTYEQAIYLYIFRHTRLLGFEEGTIGFKSARTRMACGTGANGKPMAEGSAYKKLQSLESKGAITVMRTEHVGKLLRLHLPAEIEGLIPLKPEATTLDIEDMDFFDVPENRQLILERENHRCFYTLVAIDKDNFVIDHVVSRPNGGNSYRNVVAASREANNRKGSMPAENFMRECFRKGYLSEQEFENQLLLLARLKAGELKPNIKTS